MCIRDSYTFLEQSFGAVSAIAICASGLMGLPLAVSGLREMKILKRLRAVSYTHLDVYKRQGFWLVRDEFQADYVRDIYEVEERDNELLAFAPYKQIQGRGDTLNIGMMTYTFTAPAKDILGIHMVNHAGNYVKSPSFELYGDLDKSPERKCEKASGKEKWTLKSGKLSLEFETGSPEMKFYGDGRELTCIKSKTTGMMHHKQGMNYLVSGLNLGVGELVYGDVYKRKQFINVGCHVVIAFC